ncbi:hypothetical protein FA15DRAFT_701172 [Coprinopsis marcescibilis]|uniref:FHA domain-containing protein n=1 Tax=Coprinopsis marcescibilis TaxID=230819 RepID=A0A5C3L6A7_COPMA|nr:hypothetical protein FA15DRAFT_701172 [Coprinopsis marcescibilis]
MDTTGFSQVGKYGTLSLLKRQDQAVVTSFGIDSEELTFGRDPSCSVRLYYSDIALVQCKIVFEERKAFLAILGESGLIVDGCQVYPNATSAGVPSMIPLTNNSEIEIHGKRFRFTYPPKDMRATLFAAPSPKNRKLRLSMIQSAQVFSPRPSHDPRENLRVLQSPLKNQFKSPTKPSLLSRPPTNAAPEPEEEDDIVLVDGDHPRVVQEEKDLIILEQVEAPQLLVQKPLPNYPPKTPPRRKSMKRHTLHQAVLIRSAQRAVIRAEEEEEEMEVLESVLGEDEDDVEANDDDGPPGMNLRYDDEDVEMEMEVKEEEPHDQKQPPTWRKSLGRIWPFGSGSNTAQDDNDPEEEGVDDNGQQDNGQEEDKYDDEDEDEERFDDGPAPLPTMPTQTPARRTLGSFFTPQFKHGDRSSPAPNRLSLGGGPRRVPVEEPWRVKDLVVNKDDSDKRSQPQPSGSATPRRPQLSEEERKAIQERRRSALREPDNFFLGGVPGMSPTKPKPSTSIPVVTPIKPSITFNASPTKDVAQTRRTSADNDGPDTRSLLDKMKETVETMKSRRSLAPEGMGIEATPTRLFPATPVHRQEPMSLDDPLLVTPVKKLELALHPVQAESQEHEESEQMEEDYQPKASSKSTTFSLLTPAGKKEHAAIRKSLGLPPVEAAIPVIIEPMQVDEEVTEPAHKPAKAAAARGRSRLLRPKKVTATSESSLLTAETPAGEGSTQPRRRSPRPRSPQPATEDDQTEERAPLPPSIPAPSTRTGEKSKTTATVAKRATKKVPAVEAESEESDPAPARRGRKAAAETVPADAGEMPVAARRGRSKPAAVKKETVEDPKLEDEPAAGPVKRSARRIPTAQQSTSEQSDVEPAAKTRTIKVATTRKRTVKAPVNEEALEDDPLDSILADRKAKAKKAGSSSKAKGKKQDIAEEEIEEEEPPTAPVPAPVKPARRRAATSGLKTPAPGKARAGRKTPATAPAAIEGGDKENTPGEGSSSGPSSVNSGEDGMVRLKVSRAKGRTVATTSKTVIKAEADVVAGPVRARITRATRTRTKTG